MNVDLSQLVTADQLEAEALAASAAAIKAEVQARIFAVVDQNTQASLLAAAVTGAMSAADLETFGAGQAWIEATKQAGRAALASGAAPVWPEIPAPVSDLAARF